ncbi:MAG TPA: phosphatase domain-containing protein [Gemmatimonadaceae bacterium]|nr:phosphatase domain-containing protein [Gemmatimonadaceae bacterium]
MSDPKRWAADVGSLVGGVGKELLGLAARVAHAAIGADPYEILAYRGYGNGARTHVYGRVIEKRHIGESSPTDTLIKNLYNTYRRADSDPFPFANVKVGYANSATEMKADDEGFFGGWLESSSDSTDDWQKYSVELLRLKSAPGETAPPVVEGDGEILVPSPSARFCVISDIDDTVIQSRVSNFLLAARTVMLGNARTRLPFPGVAAFYDALRDGASGNEKNPIFYVSSSPWNIYDVITEFMDIQKIPKGPLMLRDWDIGLSALSSARHSEHKGVAIRNILELYPHLDVILIGDSSQRDPEIYRQAVADFPNRVKAIYIRDVTRNSERSAAVQRLADEVLAAQSVLVLAEHTLDAAKHAADNGWISADALPKVKEEKRADEGASNEKVASPQGGEITSGTPPTVIE